MGDKKPDVSIVIPTFDQDPGFFTECLESVREQSISSWEAIVVDDASRCRNVEKIVGRLADPRFAVLRHEANRGLGAARNTGFKAARAEYVVPLDSDDRLHPDFLAVTLAELRRAATLDCVFTDFRLFGSDAGVWRYESDRTLRDMLLGQWIPGAGTLMRRTVWERVGGYAEDLQLLGNEDWDFWISALEHGVKVRHVPQPLYLYRRHQDAMSDFSLQYEDANHREIIYSRHKTAYDESGIAGEFRAIGCVRSAARAWTVGERRRALTFVARGLRVPRGARHFVRAAARLLADGVVRRVAGLRLRARP